MSINSALRYFWDFADKSWQYADTYQERLAAFQALYQRNAGHFGA